MKGINWDAAAQAVRQAAVDVDGRALGELSADRVEYEVRDDGVVVPVSRALKAPYKPFQKGMQ